MGVKGRGWGKVWAWLSGMLCRVTAIPCTGGVSGYSPLAHQVPGADGAGCAPPAPPSPTPVRWKVDSRGPKLCRRVTDCLTRTGREGQAVPRGPGVGGKGLKTGSLEL